jgi:membrane-bound metal-dependent hydrolase YbcI (DUF457 family)
MDNLTHTLIGIGLARVGLSQRLGRGTTLILAIASNLPDVDAGCVAGGPLTFLWRRGPTHSVLGALALAVIFGLVFHRFYPNLSWAAVFGLTLLGIAGHVFADLWNAYGVVLFWPFSWHRLDFDWVFIVDMAVWGILSLSLVGSLMARPYQAWIWRAGLTLLTLYIGICASARVRAAELLREQAQQEALQPKKFFIYPEPFGPQRFRGIVREADRYSVYQIWPFRKRLERLDRLAVEEPSPAVEAARRTYAGRRLDWFFGTPVWRATPDGQAAYVYGLGFRTPLLKGRSPFVFRVTPDGHVIRFRLPVSSDSSQGS